MVGDLVVRVAVWLGELPSFGWLIALIVLLSLPTTVIHELGHGIAANVLAKVPVRIELSFGAGEWSGVCRFVGDASISALTYGLIVAAGPAASLLQGVVATWLGAQAAPGTASHSVLVTFAFAGYACGLLNLVPMMHGAQRSDGQFLLDLARWVWSGRVPAWADAA